MEEWEQFAGVNQLAAKQVAEAAAGHIHHLERALCGVIASGLNAADAGAALAAEVYRYLADPEGVGTDALREAYDTFIAQHAANFTDSAREAVRG